MTISQGALDVRNTPRQALVGQLALNSELSELITLINKDPQLVQISTITVDTGTNSYTYKVSIALAGAPAIEVTYAADSSTSTTEVAVGLAAAINAHPVLRGQLAATSATNVVTITGLYPGLAFVTTETDTGAKCTISDTVQVAAAAASVAFGVAVMSQGYDTASIDEYGCLAASAKLTAQVETLGITYASGEVHYVSIEMIGGEKYQVAVASDTNHDTTATAIAAAINALMPANTVVAAAGTALVTLTGEVAGWGFKVGVGGKIGTAINTSVVHTTAGRLTDITRALAGVSVYSADEEVTTVGGTASSYPANRGMRVLKKGQIWVATSQTIAKDDPVYVELGASNTGKFYNTSSSTRAPLPASIARWERPSLAASGDSIAVLALNLGR